MEDTVAFPTLDQCDSGCDCIGTRAAEESRRSWKVEDASAKPPCSLCISPAHRFYSLTKLLLGPRRRRQRTCALRTRAIFCLYAGQGDTAAVDQGSAVPDTQLMLRWSQKLSLRRSPVSGLFKPPLRFSILLLAERSKGGEVTLRRQPAAPQEPCR